MPVSRAIRRSPSLLHAENLVALGFVFWLLLDLIQGSYDLTDAPDWAIRDAFIAIGVSAIAMWAGVAFRPWQLPKWVAQIASSPLTDRAIARLVAGVFPARDVQFRVFHGLRSAADVFVPRTAAMVGALGPRAAGRVEMRFSINCSTSAMCCRA